MGKGRRLRLRCRSDGGKRRRLENMSGENTRINQTCECNQSQINLNKTPGRFQELKRWLKTHISEVFCCLPRRKSNCGGFWENDAVRSNLFVESIEPVPLYSLARSPDHTAGDVVLRVCSTEMSDAESIDLTTPTTFTRRSSPNAPRPVLKLEETECPSRVVRTSSFVDIPGSVIEDGDLRIIEKNGEFILQRILGTPPPQSEPMFTRPALLELFKSPIAYWCPLSVTLETCSNIQWDFPKWKHPMLFNAKKETAGDRWKEFKKRRAENKRQERASKVEEELIAELELSHTTHNLDISAGSPDVPFNTPHQVLFEDGLDLGGVSGLPATEGVGNQDLSFEQEAESAQSDETTEKMIAEIFDNVDNPRSHTNLRSGTRRLPLAKVSLSDGDGQVDEKTEEMIAEIFNITDNPSSHRSLREMTRKKTRKSSFAKLEESVKDAQRDDNTQEMNAEICDIMDHPTSHNNFEHRTRNKSRQSHFVKPAELNEDQQRDDKTEEMIGEIFNIVDNSTSFKHVSYQSKRDAGLFLGKLVKSGGRNQEKADKTEQMIAEICDIVDDPASHKNLKFQTRKEARHRSNKMVASFSGIADNSASYNNAHETNLRHANLDNAGQRDVKTEKMIAEIFDNVDNPTVIENFVCRTQKPGGLSSRVAHNETPVIVNGMSLKPVQNQAAAEEMLRPASETKQQTEAASSNSAMQEMGDRNQGGDVSDNAVRQTDSMEQFIEEFLNDPIFDKAIV